MTGYPQGKKGVNIEKSRYTAVCDAIINCLKGDNLSYIELARCVHGKFGHSFSGSVRWYTEVVKLDLEARRIIERTDDKPQKYSFIE